MLKPPAPTLHKTTPTKITSLFGETKLVLEETPNGFQHKTGGPPQCSAPPDPLDLMLRPSATLTLMGDQPRRPGFVRVAAAAPTDLAFDRWPLQCGPFRPARSGTNLQGCRSYRPGRPLWQTAIRKVTETFRKGPEGPPNEPWAAAAFNPEM